MTRSHRCYCILCLALGFALAALLLLTPASASAQAPPANKPVSFINDIAPIFKENCFACHDAKKRKGKFDMTTFEMMRKGGARELDPVTPGQPEESILIDVLTATDKSRMPPLETGEALPKDKIDLIQRWIKEGAKLDNGLTANGDLLRELRVRWQPPAPPATYPHPIQVTALAFTPDSKQVVVGGNHELTIWSVAEGKLEKRMHMRAERAYALQFLPDGKLAAAGGRPGQEGDVCIYDLSAPGKTENGVLVLDGVRDSKVLLARLFDGEDSVLCLDVSADGKTIAAGGCDRMVHLWDLSAGYAKAKRVQSIENHADWVFGVALAADGKHLFSASRDKTAKVWDLKARESVVTFPAHQNGVYGVAVSKDGKSGFSVGEDNQVRQWTASGDAKQIRNMGHGKAVFKVVHSPTEPVLASCSADGRVILWKEDNGATLRTLAGHTDWVYAVTFSRDGKLLASGGFDGEVRLWNVADGKQLKVFNASPGLKPKG